MDDDGMIDVGNGMSRNGENSHSGGVYSENSTNWVAYPKNSAYSVAYSKNSRSA